MKDTTLTELLEMMKGYAERHLIKNGITLELEDDGSGEIKSFIPEHYFFDFNSLPELIEKLNS